MSRDFESGSSQWLSLASAIASGYPFTFACWIKPESNTFGTIFSISVTGSADNFHALQIAGSSVVRYRCRTTGNSDALSVATVSNGTWYFVGMIGASATDRRVWLNAVRANQTANRTPTGFDATTIGRNNAATADYFDGLIAYPTFWSSALSDADMTSLAGGAPLDSIATGSLVFHLPLTGASPEEDSIGSNDFTVNASPAYSTDEPPIAASHTSALPVKDIALASLAVSATTTEKNFSVIDTSAISVASNAISAVTTEHHTSSLPVSDVAIGALAISAETTEAASNISEIPVGAITLESFAVTAEVTGDVVVEAPGTNDGNSFSPTPRKRKKEDAPFVDVNAIPVKSEDSIKLPENIIPELREKITISLEQINDSATESAVENVSREFNKFISSPAMVAAVDAVDSLHREQLTRQINTIISNRLLELKNQRLMDEISNANAELEHKQNQILKLDKRLRAAKKNREKREAAIISAMEEEEYALLYLMLDS